MGERLGRGLGGGVDERAREVLRRGGGVRSRVLHADVELAFKPAQQAALRERLFDGGEAVGGTVGQGHARGVVHEQEQFGALRAEDIHRANRAAEKREEQDEREKTQRSEREPRPQREALSGAVVTDRDEHERDHDAGEQEGFAAGREGPFRHAETLRQQAPGAIGQQGESGEEGGHRG